MIRGHIDLATRSRVEGWLHSDRMGLAGATVLAFHDETCVGGGPIDVFRQDLADAGLGETLIYNRLVAVLMALEGVLDVGIEMFPSNDPGAPRRKNLMPANPGVRPSRGEIIVLLGGSLILLDVLIAVTY